MNTEELRLKISQKKAKKTVTDANLKVLELESSRLKKGINNLKWIVFEWLELKAYLEEQGNSDYNKNPTVKSKPNDPFPTFCFLVADGGNKGNLQVSPDYHPNRLKRGDDIYVHFEFKAFNDYYLNESNAPSMGAVEWLINYHKANKNEG